MTDIMIILILLVILASAGGYVYKAKKNGKKCIGCPASESCSGNCSGCTGSCGKDA